MKIGLINPRHEYKTDPTFRNFCHIDGITYIEAVLRDKHQVTTLDFRHDDHASLTALTNCDVVGIGTKIDSYKFLKNTLPYLKKEGKLIVVGGSLMSSYGLEDNLLMRQFPEIDFGIVGEGELAILELLGFLDSKNPMPGGMIYRNGDALMNTGTTSVAPVLDDLPEINYGAWNGLEEKANGSIFNLNLARGCTAHCSFCYKISSGVRSFSYDNIRKKIEKVAELNPKSIFLSEEAFSYDRKRAFAVSRIISDFGIPYALETRADMLDYELLKQLKETGCEQVAIGIESFDSRVRGKASKGITDEQIYGAIRDSQKAGIQVKGFFLVGLPGENKESIETTIRGIKETGIFPRSRLLIPLPGTKIYRMALQKNLIDEKELLTQFSEPKHYDTADGNWVPINLSQGLSDDDLIEARERIKELMK